MASIRQERQETLAAGGNQTPLQHEYHASRPQLQYYNYFKKIIMTITYTFSYLSNFRRGNCDNYFMIIVTITYTNGFIQVIGTITYTLKRP